MRTIIVVAILMTTLNSFAYDALKPEHPKFHPQFSGGKQFLVAGLLLGGESSHAMSHAQALDYCNDLHARVPSHEDFRRFVHFFEVITRREYSRKEFSFKKDRTYWTTTHTDLSAESHHGLDPNSELFQFFYANSGDLLSLHDLDQEHYALCMVGE